MELLALTIRNTTVKVKDLIALLNTYDQEKLVVIPTGQDGYDNVEVVQDVKLRLNAYTDWWLGAHKEDKDNPDTEAIAIY